MEGMNTSSVECLNILYEITHPQTKKDTKDYFKIKYCTIPYVEKYIDLLIWYDVPPRTIGSCLYCIEYNMNELLIQALVGGHIAEEIAELRKNTPYKYGKHALKYKEVMM